MKMWRRQQRREGQRQPFTGSAGVSPAMSAKRELFSEVGAGGTPALAVTETRAPGNSLRDQS